MFEKFLPDKLVKKIYKNAGATFGEAVSYNFCGKCVGYERLHGKWKKWEAEYSRRGYRTIPLDSFVDYGGYGMPLHGLGEKRKDNEAITLYAIQ